MIYTNSTTNYTNIDTQKSVHFTVSRTETRLKMHQTCIWNTGHMQSIAGPVHASAVWTDENKRKNNTNCSYRIFIVCRSPVSPVFWVRILLTYLFLPKQSLCTNFAITVTGNIPSIGIDGTPLVPGISMSGTSGIYYVWLPDCLCSSPPLLGFYWWGENSVASGLNAYSLQTTLIQYDSIYTQTWARSWKNLVPHPRW